MADVTSSLICVISQLYSSFLILNTTNTEAICAGSAVHDGAADEVGQMVSVAVVNRTAPVLAVFAS